MTPVTDAEKLQWLVDRAEITDTVLRYATGIDSQDWDVFRSCFADQIEVDFSSLDPAFEKMTLSADECVKLVSAASAGFRATLHVGTNHVITINGDEATCVSYVRAHNYLPNDKGDSRLTIAGRHTSHLIRTQQGWRMDRLTLTVGWVEGNRHLLELAHHG